MRLGRAARAAQTLVQKILQRHVLHAQGAVQPGDYVSLKPKHVMTHDNSYHVIGKFRSLGGSAVHDSRQLVFALDHDIQNTSEANLKRYAVIQEFARQQGVDFYPAGRGIGHQVMVEELYAEPGSLCVASDSHSNMYGGVGCLGTPVVRTDAASIWATGRTWWRVPPVVHVELTGSLPPGCSGKDVIIALCSVLNQDQVLNHAVEFGGDGVASLSIEDRLTIANMSTEWGALCGLFPVDTSTTSWWSHRAQLVSRPRSGAEPLASSQARAARANELVAELAAAPLCADEGAPYAKRFRMDLGSLVPLITGGNTLKSASVAGAERTRIQKAWLVSCVNARASDIAAAAQELRGRKVAPWVEFYVAAASSEVQASAEVAGDWKVLLDAGAIVLPPGCGACAGLGAGTIQAGEVGIAATNRNFKGRMGSTEGVVHLASPSVVAASAAEGFIVPPSCGRTPHFKAGACVAEAAGGRSDEANPKATGADSKPGLVQGFPQELTGEILWCGADNISTDSIYHGRHMYEDLSPADMANVAMENYDPEFCKTVQSKGPLVLAAGRNFGTGSSREQAAQCLKYLGIQALLAGSYSATYTRNALNNGLPLFECPTLVDYLKREFGSGTEAKIERPTVRTTYVATMDLTAWEVKVATAEGQHVGTFPLVPLGEAAQELIACGGLESWIKSELSK